MPDSTLQSVPEDGVNALLTISKTLLYYRMPKTGTSSIGQLMFFSDHGRFFNGSIYNTLGGLYQHPLHRTVIDDAFLSRAIFSFTSVRNPYTRLIAAFKDKILTPASPGHFYRELAPRLGIDPRRATMSSDTLRNSFERFLMFVEGTIRHSWPMAPDPHWLQMADTLSPLAHARGRFDAVVHLERMTSSLQEIFDNVDTPYHVSVKNSPRFNESHVAELPLPKSEPSQWYTSYSAQLVRELYKDDFSLFNYNPASLRDCQPLDRIEPDILVPLLQEHYRRTHAEARH